MAPTNHKKMERNYNLFSQVLGKVREGRTITFTKDNIAEGDRFLIFSAYKQIKCTFKRSGNGLLWVWFDCDDPMLLEECPDSFLRSILKNL